MPGCSLQGLTINFQVKKNSQAHTRSNINKSFLSLLTTRLVVFEDKTLTHQKPRGSCQANEAKENNRLRPGTLQDLLEAQVPPSQWWQHTSRELMAAFDS